MKEILKYVPGFRSDKIWKKAIAVIYYVICLISILGGLGTFLIMVTIPFILFTGIRVVKYKDKSVGVVLAAALILFIVGTAVLGGDDESKAATKTSNETLASETVPVVKEKTPEEIKIEADAKIKADADAKIIADKKIKDDAAQAIKDKEADRLQAIADKKIADAAIAAVKKAEAAAIQAEKVAYDTGITYDQLARNPDTYLGKKVKFSGKVIQVMEGDGEVQLRMAINDDYDNILLAAYDASIIKSRILENDQITIKGVSTGVITYQSTMGGNITIPGVVVNIIN